MASMDMSRTMETKGGELEGVEEEVGLAVGAKSDPESTLSF